MINLGITKTKYAFNMKKKKKGIKNKNDALSLF